jgi:N-acetylmuramoyl-L-alanine amidase
MKHWRIRAQSKRTNYWLSTASRLLACLLVGSLTTLLFTARANAATLIRDVRLSATTDSTRLVLDLSAPVATRVFALSDPDRLVIDLPDTQLAAEHLPEGRGQIKALRSGPREKGIRLVIDLAGPADARGFLVDPSEQLGHRFVVDIRPAAQFNVSTSTAPSVEPGINKSIVNDVIEPKVEPKFELKPESKPEPRVVKSIDAAHGRDIVVAIDAGHGGEDPGAIGKRGTQEKDVTLAIARKLKARIDAEPGMKAFLTRDSDVFVPLRERTQRARQANMFISIHADSVRDRNVTGSSVYVLSPKGASNEAARLLADRENAADLKGGAHIDDRDNVLASVLLDISQGASMSASIEAAGMVLQQLDHVGDVLHADVKQAGFVVLKSWDIPSMLIETAFISSPSDEARLKDPAQQQRLADAIVKGVRGYFYQNPLPGTLIADLKSKQRRSSDGAVNPSVLAGSP